MPIIFYIEKLSWVVLRELKSDIIHNYRIRINSSNTTIGNQYE